MTDVSMLQKFLAGGRVEAAVFALRPDYRAMLVAVDGLVPGPSDYPEDSVIPSRGRDPADRATVGACSPG